jgi:predicted amidophosphoribosyltransferase
MFLCHGCNRNIGIFKLVLCPLCEQSMTRSCEICFFCRQQNCQNDLCINLKKQTPLIDSLFTYYVLSEKTYTILKQWKKKSGLFFDRKVLTLTPQQRDHLSAKTACALIPIPQSFNRVWQLRHSSTKKISKFLKHTFNIPLVSALELKSTDRQQAKEKSFNRKTLANPFNINTKRIQNIQSCFLVDDFVTSGQTLIKSAYALKQAGVLNIHAIALGARPLQRDDTL